ncbi:hypothetical protein KFK09_028411 [Dendrobium nobile]|uniref:Uncharacterized protein n=1 Tax=Dendrobium nobile TaxID=94219 RepID=A0A8T3A1V1_DENNO|nr:hypothetical protein KFK09_028411 [Dendrobium nobile]
MAWDLACLEASAQGGVMRLCGYAAVDREGVWLQELVHERFWRACKVCRVEFCVVESFDS